MSDIASSPPSTGRKGLPFALRIEPRLEEPPRWYPALISLSAIVIALVIGGAVIAYAGGNPFRSYATLRAPPLEISA